MGVEDVKMLRRTEQSAKWIGDQVTARRGEHRGAVLQSRIERRIRKAVGMDAIYGDGTHDAWNLPEFPMMVAEAFASARGYPVTLMSAKERTEYFRAVLTRYRQSQ